MTRLMIVLSLASLAGCSSMRTSTCRFAKDVAVVATSPAQIACGSVLDALTYHDDKSVSAAFSPALAPMMAVKHAYFTVVHAVDAIWYPIYLPLGLEPLRLYEMDRFPWRERGHGHRWIYEELFEGVDSDL